MFGLVEVLWSVLAVRMHYKMGYPTEIWRVSLVWLSNLIFAPICMLFAIIRCPIIHTSRNKIKNEIISVMEEEIANAMRGENFNNMPDQNLDKSENSEEDDDIYGYAQYFSQDFLPMTPEHIKEKWHKRLGWKK